MSPPGKKQRPSVHRVSDYKRVSPDDVKMLLIERDQRAANDTRSAAEKWLGDPPPDRSALAQRKQQSAL